MFSKHHQSPESPNPGVDGRMQRALSVQRGQALPTFRLEQGQYLGSTEQYFRPEFTFRWAASSPHSKPGSAATILDTCPCIGPTRQDKEECHIFKCVCTEKLSAFFRFQANLNSYFWLKKDSHPSFSIA